MAHGPSLYPATYLGGYPDDPKKRSGSLIFSDGEVGMGIFKPKHALVKIEAISSIEVSGDQAAKSKFGAEFMFGVLGGLGAKNAKDRTFMTIRTTEDTAGYFLIDNEFPAEVMAAISAWMHAHTIPFYEDAQHTDILEALKEDEIRDQTSVADVADELVKLAALRKQGILTDEEFAVQKSQLLKATPPPPPPPPPPPSARSGPIRPQW